MKLNVRNIFFIIVSIYIITLPLYVEIHKLGLYYIISILLVVWALIRTQNEIKYEEKFYQKWYIARQQKYWVRISFETLKWFFFIIIMSTIPYYVVDGRNPKGLIISLSPYILLFLVISLLIGIYDYKGKEKRYHEIHERMQKKE